MGAVSFHCSSIHLLSISSSFCCRCSILFRLHILSGSVAKSAFFPAKSGFLENPKHILSFAKNIFRYQSNQSKKICFFVRFVFHKIAAFFKKYLPSKNSFFFCSTKVGNTDILCVCSLCATAEISITYVFFLVSFLLIYFACSTHSSRVACHT